MEPVFINHREDPRQFGDLVADRSVVITFEFLTTFPVVRRLALKNLANLFGRDQSANRAKVAGLPSSFRSRGESRGSPFDRGRTRGRWLGRVGRALVESLFQGGDPQPFEKVCRDVVVLRLGVKAGKDRHHDILPDVPSTPSLGIIDGQ
jgi:hypothetical protein